MDGSVKRFTKDNLDDVDSGLSGVYAIYDDAFNGAVAYVGRAKGTWGSCIKTRLKKHLEGKDRQFIGHLILQRPDDFWFSYTVIDDYDDVKEAEQAEILRLLPPGNRRFDSNNLREIVDLGYE